MKKVVFFLAVALMSLAANAQVAFSEDFDNVTTPSGIGDIPSTWTLYGDGNQNYGQQPYSLMGDSWKVINFSDMSSKMAFSCSYTQGGATCDRWMVTPRITIPASGYALQFDLFGRSDSYPESLKIMVSTSDSNKTSFTTTIIDFEQVPSGINRHLVDLSAYANMDVFIAFVNYGTNGYFVGIDDVVVSVPDPDAISYVAGYVDPYNPINTDFDVYTMVQNRGANNMTSYTLTYTLGNGTPQTRNITGIDIEPFGYYIDTLTFNYATTGVLNIGLTVSAPNGSEDPDQSDNSGTLQTTIYDPAYTVQRNILFDHFTTAQCGNCPAAHERIHEAIAGLEDRVEWVAHHVGYGTDGMTLAQDNTASGMMGFYTGSSSFAPAMMLDRDPENVPGEYGGIVGGVDAASTVHSQFLAAMAKPAFVSVNLENMSYNSSTREVSFDVTGEFKQALSGDIHLTVYITEDSIKAQQSGASGMYQHDHVLRAVVTDYWGDALQSTNANDTYTKHYTYTLPSTWKDYKCRLIAFVNKHDANSFYNRQVLNATKSGFMNSTFGIENVEPAISVNMWPNPVAEVAYIEAESTIRSYVVVNAMGQRVMGAEGINAGALELNVSNLAAGVYFVSVTTDKGVSTERLSVVK